MIEKIDTHSVFVPALKGLPVLDAGCRGFKFAQHFAQKGHRVIAMDPALDVKDPPPGVILLKSALAATSGPVWFSTWKGLEADGIVEPSGSPSMQIAGVTILDVMRGWEVPRWDVVKMDIEGAEYKILMNWPGPIANQITVEFHEHVPGANPQGWDFYGPMLAHLGQWYRVVQHEKLPYVGGENYYDSVFVLKD